MTDRHLSPPSSDRRRPGLGLRPGRRGRRPLVEPLEARDLLATFTVSNAGDSGAGSLRQAILDANETPGLDRIAFEIGVGLQTISPSRQLPAITDPVHLDGLSQPFEGRRGAPLPRIELDGGSAGPEASGLVIAPGGGGSRITGLAINGFQSRGVVLNDGGNRVEASFIGTDPTGTVARPNRGSGISIRSAGNTIGGTSSRDRNVISGNGQGGLDLSGPEASNNLMSGNFIGVDESGSRPLGNGRHGIAIRGGASGNTIGGPSSSGRNVISSNAINGIFIQGGVSGTVVQGNAIGTDRVGSAGLGNGDSGVFLDSDRPNLIGGLGSAARNVIASNGGDGVRVEASGRAGQSILGNAIFGNAGLGIDLARKGPGTDDEGDLDAAQNHPVLASATSRPSSRGERAEIRENTRFSGSLRSRPDASYRLEFFTSALADPSGFGEGETPLHALDVATDAEGRAEFSILLFTDDLTGRSLSATATDPDGNTSEFSAALLISPESDGGGDDGGGGDNGGGGDDGDGDGNGGEDDGGGGKGDARRAPADFDGDGRTDFATYSPGRRGSSRFELRLAGAPDVLARTISLGGPGDFPVVGDYDGDGLADAAVFGFDPEAGFSTFRIIRSGDGGTVTQPFGGPFDFPIAGDYDGDGKADLAVFGFSPDDGFSRFAVLLSGGGTVVRPFGGPGDFPVSGDYDGDGRDDLAVFGFSPDDGFSRFGIIYSSGRPTLSLPFGGPDDRPLQGDFDGDGLSDVAVFGFSPDEGFARFGVLSSAGEPARSIPFGGPDDRPVAGDYDGDGTTDLAVFGFSPNNGFSRFGVVPSGGSPTITREAGSAESIGLPPFSGLFRIQGGSASGTGSASRRAGGLPPLAVPAMAVEGPVESASASRSARRRWSELVDLALGDGPILVE